MTMALQQRSGIARIRLLATSVALALQILLVAALVVHPLAQAQTFTVLYSFTGGADGANPYAGLIRDAAGNLYGTAYGGGDQTCYYGDCGTVFKLDATGKYEVVHSFSGADGANPLAGLIRDAAGNLYGTTNFGGAYGEGTVFKLPLNATRKYEVLHSFTGGVEGYGIRAGLIRDAAGNLYGTTTGGGAFQAGTVFKLMLNTTGKYEVLYSFTGGVDGANPWAGLIQDAVGNLYGTTIDGGAFTCYGYGCGTVFELDATGNETVLYSFTGGADGRGPSAGLIRSPAGNLYGTTGAGGDLTCSAPYGCGTVFELDATGKYEVLHSFNWADGAFPSAGLIHDAAGNLYGTASQGGASSLGTVFKLTLNTTGKYEVLYSFTLADGAFPVAGLIRDAAGNLYGTTLVGGAFGYGTVFKLTP